MSRAECAKPEHLPSRKNNRPDVFFPEKGKRNDVIVAQTICVSCPVFRACNEYRNKTEPAFGIMAAQPASREKNS